jgi:hypothetical protein
VVIENEVPVQRSADKRDQISAEEKQEQDDRQATARN